MISKKEQEIRENISLESKCLEKLDMIRNELLPYYGNITLKELEELLWNQYLKFTTNTHKLINDD